jgi:hypothetical protein
MGDFGRDRAGINQRKAERLPHNAANLVNLGPLGAQAGSLGAKMKRIVVKFSRQANRELL